METIEFTKQEMEEFKVLRALGRPLPLRVERTSENVARWFMQEIQYDNGAVDRFHPEEYPAEWVELISGVLKEFFDANPEVLEELEEATIVKIAIGDDEEGNPWEELPGYDKVDEVLNNYFDHE